MTIHAFTSCSFSYLNRARVLASSLRRVHPDWVIWIVMTDHAPPGFDFDLAQEAYDHILTAEDLFGETTETWLFGHDVVEACTAVKGRASVRILQEPDCEKLLYFDPDTAVFNDFAPVVDILDSHDIVLTPHQTEPAPRTAVQEIRDNELAALQYGTFNLGFVAMAASDEGRRFAQWWDDRLLHWCQDDLGSGLFVDQKWCNLVPSYFDGVKILRDPGYNVASWNLSHRELAFDEDGRAWVNGVPLRFYHFTKLGPVGDTMTQRYAGDNVAVYELWWWYRNAVAQATDPAIPRGWWYFGRFDNGVKIPKSARELYRTRADLQQAFPRPLKTGGDADFHAWLAAHTDILHRQETRGFEAV